MRMSSTTNNIVEVELTYTDYTTRMYKIPIQGDPWERLNATKAAIAEFNTEAASASSAVAQTFLSASGAPVGGITEAVIVQMTTEDIYNA